jgi:hypothetical protein
VEVVGVRPANGLIHHHRGPETLWQALSALSGGSEGNQCKGIPCISWHLMLRATV